jgi:Protein of unknown function (DUF3455)
VAEDRANPQLALRRSAQSRSAEPIQWASWTPCPRTGPASCIAARFAQAWPRLRLLVANPQAAAAQQTTPATALAVSIWPIVAHGVGAQLYECKVGDTAATNWVFREPVATLVLGGGTIGHHYVGPTRELTYGEVVKGKQSGAAPGATAGPWRCLSWTSSSIAEAASFEDANLVLRLTTRGGVLKGACPTVGEHRAEPYSADYVCLR